MITFHDGPAAGTTLCLARAPLFLRVVIDQDGTVDALDQPDDEPKPTETIHVYRRDGGVGRAIFCRRGKGCQPDIMATYLLHREQPPHSAARDTEAWREWARLQATKWGQLLKQGGFPCSY